MSRRRAWRVVAGATACAIAFMPGVPAASAHSVTFRPAQVVTVCVPAGGTDTRLLYDNIPVTDQNWAIRVTIGLNGGDRTQFVWYDWFMIDNAIAAEVARARASVFDWVQVNADIEAHTLTAHSGGTVDLGVTIHKVDSQSQCFNLFARAAWW